MPTRAHIQLLKTIDGFGSAILEVAKDPAGAEQKVKEFITAKLDAEASKKEADDAFAAAQAAQKVADDTLRSAVEKHSEAEKRHRDADVRDAKYDSDLDAFEYEKTRLLAEVEDLKKRLYEEVDKEKKAATDYQRLVSAKEEQLRIREQDLARKENRVTAREHELTRSFMERLEKNLLEMVKAP